MLLVLPAKLQLDNKKRYTSTYESIGTLLSDFFSSIIDFFSYDPDTKKPACTSNMKNTVTLGPDPYTLKTTPNLNWRIDPVEVNNYYFKNNKQILEQYRLNYTKIYEKKVLTQTNREFNVTQNLINDSIVTSLNRLNQYEGFCHFKPKRDDIRYFSDIFQTEKKLLLQNSSVNLDLMVTSKEHFYEVITPLPLSWIEEKRQEFSYLDASFSVTEDTMRVLEAFENTCLYFPSQRDLSLQFEGTCDWLDPLNLRLKADFDLYTSQLRFVYYLKQRDPLLWKFYEEVLIPIMINRNHNLTKNSLDILFGIRLHSIEDYERIHQILQSILKTFLMNNHFYVNDSLKMSFLFSETEFFSLYKKNSRTHNLLALINSSILTKPKLPIKWIFDL